jgi:hypothetical protein
MAYQEIEWKFIPPYSPSFGGLWEAAVKSMKYFVKRMHNTRNLTYEEFYSLLCRIEALLNSRPLYPSSNDPVDAAALTPWHFIAQRSLKESPAKVDVKDSVPFTKKWLLVQQIQEHFWTRFTQEYPSTLQKRYKWRHPNRNLAKGGLVIVKDLNLPPINWKLGRVEIIMVKYVRLLFALKEKIQFSVQQTNWCHYFQKKNKRKSLPYVGATLNPGIHLEKLENALILLQVSRL